MECLRKALSSLDLPSKPKIALVSDTPALVKEIQPDLEEFADVSSVLLTKLLTTLGFDIDLKVVKVCKNIN